MGKAFVSKLAKEGARDPEALAAWIGRKKHGKAFGKLTAAGKKPGSASDKKSPPKQRARPRAEPQAPRQSAETPARNAGGFTAEEEHQLAATAPQTARMNMGQLQAFEKAFKPTATRTRREALQHEAVRREIARRHDAVREGMNRVRKMNQGAGKGSFMMGQRPEGVSGQRLRRMSDDDVNRNLQIAVALAKASEEQGAPMSREDKSMLYDVTSALRRENSRRNLPPVR
ncbi:hypothetical protein [Streptomyces lavendulae]|uniref:hypothetical protein n=1 Tax=Streptomyces lavendulae TaxID=1914 RepID=UPI0036E50A70